MSFRNNSNNPERNNGISSNAMDFAQNGFVENDDGSIIDVNNNIEGECITPKDEEDSMRGSKKKRNNENGSCNNNGNKDLRSGRNEPIGDSRNDSGNNLRSDGMGNESSAAVSLRNMGSGQTNETGSLGDFPNARRNVGRGPSRNETSVSVENVSVLGRSDNRRDQGTVEMFDSGRANATASNGEEFVESNGSSVGAIQRRDDANNDEQLHHLNQRRNDSDGVIVNHYDDIYDDEGDNSLRNAAEDFSISERDSNGHLVSDRNSNVNVSSSNVNAGDNDQEDDIPCILANRDNVHNSEEQEEFTLAPLENPEALIATLQKELTCPICLDYFHLPVTMNCGHTFCRYCIGHNKLSGKNCPLCRQVLGNTLCINTIISNLVRMYNFKRKSYTIYKSIELVNTVDENWWNENFIKPQVSVSLFLRIFLNDMISPPIFFDDLTTCIIDFFNVNNLWAKAKWVFNMRDCRVFSELIGYNKDDKEATNDRLRAWVENYIIKNPSMCMRKDEKVILKLYQDRTHRIESHIFDSSVLPNRLPWDGGRHVKSLIHMPHSSVSLSHLLFVKAEKNIIGVVDCGSTIGTMVKVNNFHVLKEGDVIHIGDRLEVTVSIDNKTAGMPYKGYVWNKNINKVLDRHELNELIKAERRENASSEGDKEQNNDELLNENDIPSYCENIECNLQIKFDLGSTKDDITPKTEYIDPKGVVLGRGPYAQSSYRKISVTNSNGYVSREHCLIYYDGSKPVGERWLLRDTSTLGTFLKIKPYSNPVPLPIGSIFKAGQCKIEVCSPDMAHYTQFTERSMSMHNTQNGSNFDNFMNNPRGDGSNGGNTGNGINGVNGANGANGGNGGASSAGGSGSNGNNPSVSNNDTNGNNNRSENKNQNNRYIYEKDTNDLNISVERKTGISQTREMKESNHLYENQEKKSKQTNRNNKNAKTYRRKNNYCCKCSHKYYERYNDMFKESDGNGSIYKINKLSRSSRDFNCCWRCYNAIITSFLSKYNSECENNLDIDDIVNYNKQRKYQVKHFTMMTKGY